MKKNFRFSQYFYAKHLLQLANETVNFDTKQPIQGDNWHQYDTHILLGIDTPAHPIWDKACQLVETYQFAPPEVMQIYFDADLPLHQRDLSLNSQFLFLKFHWGGRIARVLDEIRETDQGDAHVWGCSYQTLESHFEQGELTTEIWKYLETNEVYFRMHAYSRVGHIVNPIYRLAFPLALRFMRPYFVWRSLRRIKKFVN